MARLLRSAGPWHAQVRDCRGRALATIVAAGALARIVTGVTGVVALTAGQRPWTLA